MSKDEYEKCNVLEYESSVVKLEHESSIFKSHTFFLSAPVTFHSPNQPRCCTLFGQTGSHNLCKDTCLHSSMM